MRKISVRSQLFLSECWSLVISGQDSMLALAFSWKHCCVWAQPHRAASINSFQTCVESDSVGRSKPCGWSTLFSQSLFLHINPSAVRKQHKVSLRATRCQMISGDFVSVSQSRWVHYRTRAHFQPTEWNPGYCCIPIQSAGVWSHPSNSTLSV